MAEEYESNEFASTEVMDVDVLTGEVRMIKPTLTQKFAKVFFPADVTDVGQFFIWRVLVPNFKLFMLKVINETFDETVSRTISSAPVKRYKSGSWLEDNVSFGDSSDLPAEFTRKEVKALDDPDFTGFEYRVESAAENARNQLYLTAKRYGAASMSDLCRCSKYRDPVTDKVIEFQPKWNYNSWGWTVKEIEKAQILHSNGWYKLKLPEAKPLNDLKTNRG